MKAISLPLVGLKIKKDQLINLLSPITSNFNKYTIFHHIVFHRTRRG